MHTFTSLHIDVKGPLCLTMHPRDLGLFHPSRPTTERTATQDARTKYFRSHNKPRHVCLQRSKMRILTNGAKKLSYHVHHCPQPVTASCVHTPFPRCDEKKKKKNKRQNFRKLNPPSPDVTKKQMGHMPVRLHLINMRQISQACVKCPFIGSPSTSPRKH